MSICLCLGQSFLLCLGSAFLERSKYQAENHTRSNCGGRFRKDKQDKDWAIPVERLYHSRSSPMLRRPQPHPLILLAFFAPVLIIPVVIMWDLLK